MQLFWYLSGNLKSVIKTIYQKNKLIQQLKVIYGNNDYSKFNITFSACFLVYFKNILNFCSI